MKLLSPWIRSPLSLLTRLILALCVFFKGSIARHVAHVICCSSADSSTEWLLCSCSWLVAHEHPHLPHPTRLLLGWHISATGDDTWLSVQHKKPIFFQLRGVFRNNARTCTVNLVRLISSPVYGKWNNWLSAFVSGRRNWYRWVGDTCVPYGFGDGWVVRIVGKGESTWYLSNPVTVGNRTVNVFWF